MNFCEIFKKTVQRVPSNIAVIYQNTFVSYQELDCLSTKLASQLITRGIKPGDIVGLGIYNSTDLIIGFLGILKAGGVYLPLDPNYPKERIKEMISDSGVKLIIVDTLSEENFSFWGGSLYSFERETEEPICDDLPSIPPDQAAYIIYTSGSTGTPKGIIVSHRALKHAADSFSSICPSPPNSILTGSISFDPSILIIIHALFTGGKICLYDNKEGIDLKDFAQIVRIIQHRSVDFILSTPSFYSHVLKEGCLLKSLKHIFLCGEKIHTDLIHDHIHFAPNANLYNAYGPSEYAIGSTVGLIYDSIAGQQYPITIGKPFSENKLFVLDSEQKLIGCGEKGEFFVGGPGLAIGYLNQDELTKEKFVFCKDLEEKPLRLYQTGDLGYQIANGDFIFSGRKDFQVKINGHRVELEEIEAKILSFSGIDKVAVLAKDNRLFAFYSLKRKDLRIEDLKQFLEETLPSYMIPNTFIEIHNWPKTNNGKIDRKALLHRAS